MRISMALGTGDFHRPETFLTGEAIAEMAVALERAGIDACYVTEHPAPARAWLEAGGHSALDPFVALAVAAAHTRRLRLHTHIVVLPYRNPFLTAKAAASLDIVSGGRMILGVGVGYMKAEFEALGVPFAERGALVDEALAVLREAWSGEAVTRSGRHFEAADVQCLPMPAQRPGPPIWVGGNSEKAIRRAVASADGWSPFPARAKLSAIAGTDTLASIEELAAKIDFARALCAEQGRSTPLDVCMVPFGMTLYSDRPQSPAAIIDELEALAAVGVSWAAIALPARDRSEYVEKALRFGEEVVAKLSSRAAAQA